MPQLLKSTLLIISALFPIVNPLGSAPIFLSLTSNYSEDERRILAWRVALNSFILLVASYFVGTHILSFFGISLPVVQVGGGLVVATTGWSLLKQKMDETPGDKKDVHKSVELGRLFQQAFYPLTLPLTVGPGSISVAITLGANESRGNSGIWLEAVAAFLGALAIAIMVYLCYAFADKLARVLGQTSMTVIMRLSAFLLVCIGVQIIWNGLSALLKTVMSGS